MVTKLRTIMQDEAVIAMIDAMIVKRRVEGAITPVKQQPASG